MSRSVVTDLTAEACDLDAILDATEVSLSLGGHRFTAGRRRIIELLHQADRPMSVDDLRAADPRMPTSSVYRSVSLLHRSGVVVARYLAPRHVHYELASTSRPIMVHLVCRSCDLIQIAPAPSPVLRGLEAAVDRANEAHFVTMEPHVVLRGRCRTCRAAAVTPLGGRAIRRAGRP